MRLSTLLIWLAKSAARQLGRTAPLLAGLVLAATGLPVPAAVTITPVVIEVAADGRAVVKVRNDRARPVLYQVTLLRWNQLEGVDVYTPTQDFIASPPLFTLDGAASQTIRIGLRNPTRLDFEQSYRMILAEVVQPSDLENKSGTVEFNLQYSIPVFVTSDQGDAKPRLVWQMRVQEDALVLRADNLSPKRIVVNMVGLTGPDGQAAQAIFASKERTTVLAHAWREWRLPVPADKRHLAWRIVVLQSDGDTAVLVPDEDMRPSAR